YLGLAYVAQGDYRRAVDYAQQTVTALEGTPRGERFGELYLPTVSSRRTLAECHAEIGTFAEGRAVGDEGLQIAEAARQPASLAHSLEGVGLLALRQGDLPSALHALERAMRLCQDADLRNQFPTLAVLLGEAYTLAGRIADAVSLLTQAMEQTLATGMV